MKKSLHFIVLLGVLLGHTGFGQNESVPVPSVFELAELDRAPVPYLQISPTYPAELKADRVRGRVAVVFIVDEEGRVIDPTIEGSSHPGFNEAAMAAVRKWKFKPGIYENRAVKTRVRLPMAFDLKRVEAYDID